MSRSNSPKNKSPIRKPAKINWFAKYKSQMEMYQKANLKKELEIEGSEFDETDEKFVAPSILTKEGDLNLELLFKFDLQPADRRYLLRKMEKAREEFRDRILVETRRKQEEERKRLEEAEDEKEIRLVKERFKNIQQKLYQKAEETTKFQLTTREREIEEIRQHEENRKKRLQEELETLQQREFERLRRLPDFPSTFTVCRRLHSPSRNRKVVREEQQHYAESLIASSVFDNKTPLSKTMTKTRRKSIIAAEQGAEDEEEGLQNHRKKMFEVPAETSTALVSVSYAVSKRFVGQLELVTYPVE